jgi:hypothetical protein
LTGVGYSPIALFVPLFRNGSLAMRGRVHAPRFRWVRARQRHTLLAVAVMALLCLGRTTAAVFIVENTEDSGLGSLRLAILAASALPGPDQIHFNIPGPGTHTITLLTELPPLIDAVTIDGTTQPGYAGVPLVALNGDQVSVIQGGFLAGFRILGGNCTVRGFYIYSFGGFLVSEGVGIAIIGNGGNVIEGNYIGPHPDGFQYAGSATAILCIASTNNLIGGPFPASRNVISYNYRGIIITNGSNNLLQGNFIGTDPSGSSANPNIVHGVLISGGTNRIVENRIAFNWRDGIRVTGINNGNTISANMIYRNVALGINLEAASEPDGFVTPNDDGDADTGPNALQNYPVITHINEQAGSTLITGYLPSSPNRTYRLEFFRSREADTNGFGEGEVYLGSTLVQTDPNGLASFAFSIPGTFPTEYFTATATDQESGDTSEFSQAVRELQLSIVPNGAGVELRFPAAMGRNYTVEQRMDLHDGTGWLPVPGAENLTGNGSFMTVHETLKVPCCYYRIRQH